MKLTELRVPGDKRIFTHHFVMVELRGGVP